MSAVTLTMLEGLQHAAAAFGDGRLAETERLCLAMLAVEPDNFDANYFLAVTRFRSGRPDAALASYDRALAIRPDHVGALGHRGVILLQRDRLDDALADFDRILLQRPDDVDALSNRGLTLQRIGRLPEALACYDAVLAAVPDHRQALGNRGVLLKDLKRHDAALASLDRALLVAPDDPELINNRGAVLKDLRRFEEALAAYDRALALQPDFATAHHNRGNALRDLGRRAEALASYDRALALEPDDAGVLSHRGNVLMEERRTAEGLASHARALALRPDVPEGHFNFGCALEQLGRFAEAVASYERAVAIRPDYADAFANHGRALFQLRRIAEARVSYERALACDPDHRYALNGLADCAVAQCDWQLFDRIADDVRRHAAGGGSIITPFVLLFFSADPPTQLACARHFIRDRIPAPSPPIWRGETWRNDRIRLAYVSPDLRQHPVAELMAEIIERHDRSRFEVFGVSLGPDDGSEVRGRLIRAFDRFHDVRAMREYDAAALIHKLRTDIVIDLAGYTLDCRPEIFAARPAPIAVGYLGFPATMGADFIDYILADEVILPFTQRDAFAEKIVHLPVSYQANGSRRPVAAATPTRQEAGLPDTGFVFCCFNNHTKLAPPVFDVWMRLLGAVGGSVLWLSRAPQTAVANLRAAAAQRGIDPDRLIFAPRTARIEDHLARQRLAGLFLDTLPYNAHTTASDALWAGLPVLTCRGTALAGRVAASLLEAVGLPELVTPSLAAYEALALRLATDPPLLAGYRARLERHRPACTLFDGDRFRRHLEAAYTTMWETWQRGDAPRAFTVPPSAGPPGA